MRCITLVRFPTKPGSSACAPFTAHNRSCSLSTCTRWSATKLRPQGSTPDQAAIHASIAIDRTDRHT